MTQLALARLDHSDSAELSTLLSQSPIDNVYLLSEAQSGLDKGNWWGLGTRDGLRATLLAGPLVVPWIPDLDDAPRLVAAMVSTQFPVRMLVGPRDSVMALHQASGWTAREIRCPQPLLQVTRETLAKTTREVPLRLATRADLAPLTIAAAAMHEEEMGTDPLQIDANGWWRRMANLVDRGWSWVWMEDGAVVFKAELSAMTPDAAQIQGVFTAPGRRRQGVALGAMHALCAELLDQVRSCTLYVNDFNHPARRVYERLGFQARGDFATVIY